ncbi:D-alanyl-D-alanine carboxypeptidase family protein [Marivita hallyeonensis]|uniref:D-alanyl-D-alanine carboxypeptidase n=1 Tax=Marivita hallyeonensis TaxID=996342 RepID=A0A1M5ME27_9RHOB|nr:D-alanyl-D-alanine carboxypeptidase family protein [Marivita hallyeonensis]SHG75487.1 D-alanyl-D-alanine carboxypeptidase [Marivita hallyeonensis]
MPGRIGLYVIAAVWLAILVPISAMAAPYAAMVMDARNGEVLHARNADTRLHPASLTKMMTLYVVFEAVQNGELSMDTKVLISKKAAAEPPSKLGLRAGSTISLRYLVRAAAIKSANDAATAIAEAVSGSEAAFARRMNRTAKALGMSRTTFKNAHGLTESGHMSTARDMTILGRHVLYDYPQYYNLFSRRSADAGIKAVANTNRRFLNSYRGADGIKTGYTRAAGFNLVASAERGSERIIVTVFGGNSTASRNAQVAKLMDLGFNRAPSRMALRTPRKPPYMGRVGPSKTETVIAKSQTPSTSKRAKSIRVVAAAVTKSLRPTARPVAEPVLPDTLVAELQEDIQSVLAEVQTEDVKETAASAAQIALAADAGVATSTVITEAAKTAPKASVKPVVRPRTVVLASARQTAPSQPVVTRETEVVSRISTSGGRHWGINVGRYSSRFAAEKALLKTALAEVETLDGSLRKVVNGSRGYDANFMGLTREAADLACRRLQARQVTCFMIGPG